MEGVSKVKAWKKIGQAVDSVNEWGGKVGWFLILLMMSFGVYDVIMRYLFDRPSQWIYLILQAGMVFLTIFAGGYALQHGAFVKMDAVYAHFSRRGKAIADAFTFVAPLLFCTVLIWKGIETAQLSIAMRQVTPTAVPIPLYPIKAMIPLGAFLVLIVAVKKFISNVGTAIHKETE